MSEPLMYGIVDLDGRPYMAEDCVCEDRETLETEVCQCLNENEDTPKYRVVALYASEPQLVERCMERHPEGGQCELRKGHTFNRHLAGMIMWVTDNDGHTSTAA